MDSRCLRDLDHLGNRNRRPRAARSGRLYIGFRGDLNPIDTSNPSSNLYIVISFAYAVLWIVCAYMFMLQFSYIGIEERGQLLQMLEQQAAGGMR